LDSAQGYRRFDERQAFASGTSDPDIDRFQRKSGGSKCGANCLRQACGEDWLTLPYGESVLAEPDTEDLWAIIAVGLRL
jgi:hypothetical protein